jgi:hypothetical protein
MANPDPFADFQAAVRSHFVSLALGLGLGPPTERTLAPEIYIEFSAGTRQLVVGFEYSSGPWVEIGVTVSGREDRFGLHTLEEDIEGNSKSIDGVFNLRSTKEQVQALAELTRRYAAALLTGDVARLPSLRRLRAKAHRERNLHFVGTRSGAAPLDHRPTLSELFATARGAECPADVRLFCVYQAVWDHGYTVEEVARFIGVNSADIQEIVDAFDNVGDTPTDLEALRNIVRADIN